MTFKQKLKKYRKIIFILLYILIIPIICIPSIYITTYNKNKPVVFANTDVKTITSSKLDYFDLDVYAEEYVNATSITPGSITLKATINNIKENITNVSIQFEIDTNWKSNKVTNSTTRDFNSKNALIPGEEYEIPYEIIMRNISTIYPVKSLPFITIKNPYVYAKIIWEYDGVEEIAIVRYTYDQYIISGKTIVT